MHRASCALLAVFVAAGATALGAASAMSTSSDRGWEVSLGHQHSRVAAAAVLKLVASQSRATGLKAVIEVDGKTDFEIAITGFATQKQAAAARTQARAGFSQAAIEHT